MTKFVRPVAAAAKTATRKTKTVDPITKVELPKAEAAAADDDTLSAWQQVQDAVNNMLGKISKPSWARQLCNAAIGMVVYASTFYCCMQLIDMLMLALMAYTGTGFISFMVSFFAIFAAFMLSWQVGKMAFLAAESFSFEKVKTRVTGWFDFGSKHAAVAR